jgi:hypothetical protein
MGIIRRKTGEESPQRFQQTRHIEMGAADESEAQPGKPNQENPSQLSPGWGARRRRPIRRRVGTDVFRDCILDTYRGTAM